MSDTIVGTFRDRSTAEQVVRDLTDAGFGASEVHIISAADRPGDISTSTATRPADEGFWASVKHFFGFGEEEDYSYERSYYKEALRRGDVAVVVDTDSQEEADRAVAIMNQGGAIDVDERAAEFRKTGWMAEQPASTTATGTTRATTTTEQTVAAPAPAKTTEGEETIPVIEEQLKVGKRAEQRGRVRIHSRVIEKPVEENVQLRDERVDVQHRAADRPATAADRPFEERTIEATETSERPVVQKEARVVEEVVIGKKAEERTETVHDTVRRTDVEVEQVPEEYRPGYEFGSSLNREERYRGRDWTEIEPEVRSSWQQRYPQSRWDDVKGPIRQGWEGSKQAGRS